jgi:hypothetical protein
LVTVAVAVGATATTAATEPIRRAKTERAIEAGRTER